MKELLNLNTLEKEIKNMSDKEWQQKFEIMKLHIKPVNDRKMTRHARKTYILGKRWTLSDNEYCGETLDQRYCNFINDVLKQIRMGRIDYCYYYYQIMDLLKFEPRLKTQLVHDDANTYFKVWLDEH